MADAATTRYAFVKPEVGASADTWGGKWNQNTDDYDALLGAITTGGSSNAYTLTTGLSLAGYVTGQSFDIIASFSNTSTVTIAVDGLATKAITKNGTTALASGDIVSGNAYRITYDGTRFQLMGAIGPGSQPLDATLTALAALSWSSATPVIQFTAADTVSLTSSPTFTGVIIGDGSVGTPAIRFGSDPDSGFYYSSSEMAWSFGGVARLYTNGLRFRFALPVYGNASTDPANPAFSPSEADPDNGSYYIGTNHWGLAAGGAKVIDIATTGVEITGSLRGRIPVSSETSGTLTSASANKKVKMTGDCTINDGVFSADDIVIFENNGAATRQIIQDTGMTLRLNGTTTTGTRTIAVRGLAAVSFDTNAEAIVSGNVS